MAEAINQISYEIELHLSTLPPSAQEIYTILKNLDKPSIIEEIEQRTNYSSRSVRTALKLLCTRGLIRRHLDIHDLRRHYYSICDNF